MHPQGLGFRQARVGLGWWSHYLTALSPRERRNLMPSTRPLPFVTPQPWRCPADPTTGPLVSLAWPQLTVPLAFAPHKPHRVTFRSWDPSPYVTPKPCKLCLLVLDFISAPEPQHSLPAVHQASLAPSPSFPSLFSLLSFLLLFFPPPFLPPLFSPTLFSALRGTTRGRREFPLIP